MEDQLDNSDLSTPRLAQLVHQKSTLVIELHKLLSRQRSMIDDGQFDLLALLAVKQRLLEALGIVDRQMDPFRTQEPDARNWASPQERQQCRDEADQCEALFREVKQLEAYCLTKMQDLHDKAKEQLQGVDSARRAAQAYEAGYQNMAPPKNSLDLSSEG